MSIDPQNIAKQIPPSVRGAIEQIPIVELVFGSRQLRIRKKSVLDSMGASIRQFGFLVPVIIDASNHIICGKGRVEAGRLIGMTEVPCIRVTNLSEAEKRVFAIAENQLGQLAGWDQETLRIELTELTGMDLSFSLELTGFSSAKIDAIVFGGDGNDARGDAIPALPDQVVSRVAISGCSATAGFSAGTRRPPRVLTASWLANRSGSCSPILLTTWLSLAMSPAVASTASLSWPPGRCPTTSLRTSRPR